MTTTRTREGDVDDGFVDIFFADNDDCYTQLKDKFILSGIIMMSGVGIRMSWFILISDKAY